MLFIFVVFGYILMFVGALWLIVKCFQENIIWGLCSIFFPGLTWIVFLLCYPAECWRPTATYTSGIACIFLPFFVYASNPDLLADDIAVIAEETSRESAKTSGEIKLEPYRTVHNGVTPVSIERVPIREKSKVKYLDISFHDYFIEGSDKMFAVEYEGNKGLLNAKKIDKELCDSETIAKIRSFAGKCMKSSK